LLRKVGTPPFEAEGRQKTWLSQVDPCELNALVGQRFFATRYGADNRAAMRRQRH
jgi:hypothetical protein